MPYARAFIKGNFLAPKLDGIVELYPYLEGTLVKVEIANLPPTKPISNNEAPVGPFGFHIHDGVTCEDLQNKFEQAKGHYNPSNMPHAFHAGDLPSLLSNYGYAYMIVYTDRFKPEEVIGKAIIIHKNPDDYRTQPAGNAGDRIVCGLIEKINETFT